MDSTTEAETTQRKAGRPRKVGLDDDDGLLDETLKVQRAIMNDRAANLATRERSAGEVRELVTARAQRKDETAKTALTAEIDSLRRELAERQAQIEDLKRSNAGKVNADDFRTMRTELTRLRSDAQTHGARLSTLSAERDTARTALRYLVQTLGVEGCSKAAMKLLIDGSATKTALELLGVDARAWLQMNAVYGTKSALLDVIKGRTSDRETELTAYCRLRLAVEHNIPDAERFLKNEEQRRIQGETQHIKDAAFLNIERRLSI